MAYDEATAERVRKTLRGRKGLSERKMFTGIAFLLHGNMFCGVLGKDIMLRLGAERTTQALREPHTRPMDFTGKPLKTMVYLSPGGHRSDADLRRWVRRAIDFAGSLPPK